MLKLKNQKTDNSYLDYKIKLRINHLPDKQNIKVLDLFHGIGIIWNQIKKQTDKNIEVTGIEIDKNKNSNLEVLHGDNLKYLKKLDLSKYDIIDIDTYGSPYKQLKLIFKNKTLQKGTAFFLTDIQIMFGKLPDNLLKEVNITKKMINKIPTLFNKIFRKIALKSYLYKNGIKHITYCEVRNKMYIYFEY